MAMVDEEGKELFRFTRTLVIPENGKPFIEYGAPGNLPEGVTYVDDTDLNKDDLKLEGTRIVNPDDYRYFAIPLAEGKKVKPSEFDKCKVFGEEITEEDIKERFSEDERVTTYVDLDSEACCSCKRE
jgi:hypothetical protein